MIMLKISYRKITVENVSFEHMYAEYIINVHTEKQYTYSVTLIYRNVSV